LILVTSAGDSAWSGSDIPVLRLGGRPVQQRISDSQRS
jgi:hypothetical protein